MAYQSKYKGVLVFPSDKDILNGLRAQVPTLTEAEMMTLLIAEVDMTKLTATLLNVAEVRANEKPAKKAVQPAKKAAKAEKAEKVDKPVKEKKVKKVKEPVCVATEEETDKVRELHDKDEPAIRVVVG